jgi:hypothetical protein
MNSKLNFFPFLLGLLQTLKEINECKICYKILKGVYA